MKIESVHHFFQWVESTTHWTWSSKLVEANMAPGNSDRVVLFYNKWQIPFAFLVCLLMAVTQFFKYKQTDFKLLRVSSFGPS